MLKNLFFAGILKVNDENSRIRIQNPDPNQDPLDRGMDPRIRIRIHPNTAFKDPRNRCPARRATTPVDVPARQDTEAGKIDFWVP